MATMKPTCGGGGSNPDDYDLPLHVLALCEYHVILLFNRILLTLPQFLYCFSVLEVSVTS